MRRLSYGDEVRIIREALTEGTPAVAEREGVTPQAIYALMKRRADVTESMKTAIQEAELDAIREAVRTASTADKADSAEEPADETTPNP